VILEDSGSQKNKSGGKGKLCQLRPTREKKEKHPRREKRRKNILDERKEEKTS
jgi:hypothetical protein